MDDASTVTVALALPLVLLAAYLIGLAARWVLRGRVRLSTSTTIVLSVLGISVGLLVGGLTLDAHRPWNVGVILIAVGVTALLLAGFAAVAARLQPPPTRESVPELIARGESDRLEFKSSARYNLHTGTRDEKIEAVIAKTVAAFANADGGTLLIGVADDGEILGLANDLTIMKAPDTDRFELWLRDFLSTVLGPNAAALPVVDFARIPVDEGSGTGERIVCRVVCPASPRPVYVRPAKGNGPTDFFVRTGNSTRPLRVDEATDYAMVRWPLGIGRTVAAQLRAAARGGGR